MNNEPNLFPARGVSVAAFLALAALAVPLFTAHAAESVPISSADNSADADHSGLKWSDKRFVRKVSETNQKEIAFAQLASQQANNSEVRSFAQQLANDHATLGQELMQLAREKDVTLEKTSTMGMSMAGGAPAGTSIPGAYVSPTNDNDRTASGYDRAGVANSNTGPLTATGSSTLANPDLGWSGDHEYKHLAHQNGQNFDREFVDMMVDDHESTIKLFEKKAQDADDPAVRAFAAKYLPSLREHLQHAKALQKTVE